MSDEAPEKKIDEAVVTKPEETTPAQEVTPPAVTPPPAASSGIEETVKALQEQVESLTEAVNGVLNSGSTTPDSTPVKKPWTHWSPN